MRLDCAVALDPLEFGGQSYAANPGSVEARLDVSRPASGYAFRLRFPMRIEGPCARCLEGAVLETDVDVREVDQPGIEDEELRSPYVVDEQLHVGRWAHDAAVLAMPARVLCRPDCAGLCPVCGASLNNSDPAEHRHDTGGDPRWAKLRELKSE